MIKTGPWVTLPSPKAALEREIWGAQSKRERGREIVGPESERGRRRDGWLRARGMESERKWAQREREGEGETVPRAREW